MSPTELGDATGLLAAVASSGALVAGVVQALKAIAFPATWQTGRAPMVAAAILSALAVIGALLQLQLDLTAPATWSAFITAWLLVYGAAVAAHQTVTKAARIVAGTTDPTGPDDGP